MADSRTTSAKPTRKARTANTDASRQNLLAEPRRMKILEWLQEEGSARVRDLSVAFGVSEATIRQDLEKLDTDGFVVREHGGAYLKSMPQQVQSMSLQHLTNMDNKKKIGRAAAALVGPGETIIIDSGSTTTEVANSLLGHHNLNVITNAINIALTLGALPSMTVHMSGGLFKAPTLSLTGEKSGDFFEGIFAEKLFLATAAVSFEAGLTFPAMADLYVKRAMIKAASKVYLVADSSKIGRTSFSSLGPIDLIGGFITDDGITDADRAEFEKRGIEVIVAR
ncbi:DeoR/GlpR family DNA-binding transcription regulator [Devosia sp. J2-20]|nr:MULTISPECIES: DeoR/GlpR family DNA-binding transcription regulator [Devosia]MCZ4346023.1 DeoR/GlpR family DNA-binding transcription regulator [Devosia neptuniae]WDQ97935.1 DeoR/GlpR family DNA-binding transcription regulator [Devosia sp. J2-20]